MYFPVPTLVSNGNVRRKQIDECLDSSLHHRPMNVKSGQAVRVYHRDHDKEFHVHGNFDTLVFSTKLSNSLDLWA